MSNIAWIMMILESTALAWIPAVVLAALMLVIGLYYGWGWKALYLLPVGPVLVAMILAGWSMGLLHVPTPAPPGTMRIAHANTLYDLENTAPKLEFAINSGAETLSFLEISGPLGKQLKTISGTYPHQAMSGGNLPMALLSIYPITRAQAWGERAVLYHIAKPKVPYYVLQVHPQSPHSRSTYTERNAKLEKITTMVKGLPQPLVMLGDMNTTPWDDALAPLFNTVQQAGGWRSTLPTFPSWMPVTPIDALYYTQPFTPIGVQHIRVPKSDHLAIVVDMKDARIK